MRIHVYAHRSEMEQAMATVQRLKAEGHSVVVTDVRGFDGQINRCDRCVTDHDDVAEAHTARGIEVVPLSDTPAPSRRPRRRNRQA